MTATDGTRLYSAILAAPDEDVPRLMFADWLEEQGPARVTCPACPKFTPVKSGEDAVRAVINWGKAKRECPECSGAGTVLDASARDRAEFVRLQCELEPLRGLTVLDAARVQRLLDRETVLLAKYGAAWRAAGKCPECEGKGKVLHRPGPQQQEVACPRCDGAGDVGCLTGRIGAGAVDITAGRVAGGFKYPVTFRRGLVDAVECRLEDAVTEVDVKCEACAGSGALAVDSFGKHGICAVCSGRGTVRAWRPTARAVAWLTHFPVTRVVPTDQMPIHRSSAANRNRLLWDWSSAHLPGCLFDELAAMNPDRLAVSDDSSLRWVEFDTRERATDALARATAEFVRGFVTPRGP